MIRTENLGMRFGKRDVLQGVNLTVPHGGATALIGANGAGKSTTIRILMNLLEPTNGIARILGVDSRSISHLELAQIGYVAESQEMPAKLTTGEYLAYLRPFYPTWDADLEREVINALRLPLDVRIGHLSHGMRMKLAVACALPARPKLMILDEPLSGLDPLVRDDLVESLLKQAGETTILISSQELGEIEGLATDVAFLEDGQLRFQESMETLTSRFREVRVTLFQEAQRPERPLDDWLLVQVSGNVLTFVETKFSEVDLAERVRSQVGETRRIEAQPMPLRAIFTTLARAKREGVRS